MKGKIFSPGKLLLTSEYVVLDGALALAVPTKWGQEFFYEEMEDDNAKVFWSAKHQNKSWLEAEIDYKSWKITNSNLPDAAAFILNVLKNVQHLSSLKFKGKTSYRISTNLEFPADYGLGSSSTLMTNLAEWAQIDAFELNELSLGGSGYDIAVAMQNAAIIYQNLDSGRLVKTIDFNPVFKNELIFIHLNQKQDSREGINLYRSKKKSPGLITDFSELTEKVIQCGDLQSFGELMNRHEQKLSNFLSIKTTKDIHFKDCPVFVKSLGAWGGDFVMSCRFPGFEDYFRGLGFNRILGWKELIN